MTKPDLDKVVAELKCFVIGNAITGNVATKGYLDSLKTEINGEIKSLKSELKLWIVSAIAIGIGLIKVLDYLLPGVP